MLIETQYTVCDVFVYNTALPPLSKPRKWSEKCSRTEQKTAGARRPFED